jgi:hypothetical protein
VADREQRQFEGAVQAGDGTLGCVASYDQAFAPLGSSCMP